MLGAEPLTLLRTVNILGQCLIRVLERWRISLEQVPCVMGDTSLNIRKALFVGCEKLDSFANQIQLVVNNGIFSQKYECF